jgi:hypothetical protein
VRVPEELESLDLSSVIHECENYLRDLESATLLKAQGNREAAEALIRTRQADLGRKVAMKVWEARVAFGAEKRAKAKGRRAGEEGGDAPGETHAGAGRTADTDG